MTKEERKQRILAIWDKLGTVIGWTETGSPKTITKEDCAEEILAIPIDVPDCNYIHKSSTDYADKRGGNYWYDALYTAYKSGMNNMKEEIERRNQK